MEGIDLDSILDEDEINLFNDVDDDKNPDPSANKEDNNPDKNDVDNGNGYEGSKEKDTTEVDPNTLFGDGVPENVGGEEENKDKDKDEDPNSDKGGDSPKANFFSSVADTLAEEGVFPDLSPDDIKGIKTPEDFLNAIQNQINAGLTEKQKRVSDALDNDVEPNVIKQYEGVIGWLENISDDTLSDEGEQAEALRKRLIFQDFKNRKFSDERAQREVEKAIENGTDIEDAKDALKSNISFFKEQYKNTLDEAKQAKEREKAERESRALNLQKSIMDNDKFFGGDIVLDKATRKKVYDNISKPVYRDPKTGELYTAIQKYELDNSDDFLAKLGLVFTLTDGFKNLNGLTKGKIKKEVGKGLRDLERRINNTSRDSYGNLKYSSGVDDDSYLGKGIKLAL